MDEKHPMASPPSLRRRGSRSAIAALLFCAALFTFYTWTPSSLGHRSLDQDLVASMDPRNGQVVTKEAVPDLIPLEAHMISKCPDTRDALRLLVVPAMERIHAKVNFTISYIGAADPNDGGVSCMHGPSECMGNILELCALRLYPDPKISLGFIMCLTRDYASIPDRSLVEDCALEHAIDFKALNNCATKDNGAYGLKMLRKSVDRSAKLNIGTSCTIRLNNEIYCIRDGGEWRDCPNGAGVNDLIIAVEKLRQRSLKNPAA